MNLILMGSPGAGKGTQAKLICHRYSLTHLATGDIFRYHIKSKTELGLKVQDCIEKGKLVSDAITIELIKKELEQRNAAKGFLFDGFPRTVPQADALNDLTNIDKIINLKVDANLLALRFSGRRVCRDCQEPYHISSYDKPVCKKCGGVLYQRNDDNEDVVKDRLDIYHSLTAPLLEYYQKNGKFIEINGMQSVEDVFGDIVRALN